MLLVVLLATISLAAAQCGNSCSCGNSACCSQSTYAAGSPYSIFNFGYGQQHSYAEHYTVGQRYGYGQQYGSNGRRSFARSSCLKVNPINFSLSQVVQNQPVYTRVVEDNEGNREVDNICTTYFPLPDDPTTFVAYYSVVYCDGSNRITTTIATETGAGTCIRGNAYYSYTQRLFASLGNNMFIGCNRDEYGDNTQVRVYAISLGSVTPLGESCAHQIQNIIQCVGQDEGGLYVLPYRRPTRCVTQQVCSITNPLLFTAQMYGVNNYCINGRC